MASPKYAIIKNLKNLLITVPIINFKKLISNIPESQAATLYGIGVNPAIITPQTPYFSKKASPLKRCFSPNNFINAGVPRLCPKEYPTMPPNVEAIVEIIAHVKGLSPNAEAPTINISGGTGWIMDSVKATIDMPIYP